MKCGKKLGLVSAFILAGCILLTLVWSPGEAGNLAVAGIDTGQQSLLAGSPGAGMMLAQEGNQEFPAIDQACRLCHQDSKHEIEFSSGETLPVSVDLTGLDSTAHGTAGADLSCTGCHSRNDYGYPHNPVTAVDLRSFEIAKAETCVGCHQDPHLTGHPGPSSEAPVVCTDCHGSHDVLTVAEMEAGEASDRCSTCHVERNIGITDQHVLTDILRKGLFADRVNQDYCLSCHSQDGLTLVFANGDELSLTIDEDDFHDSVHGEGNPWQPLDCVDCHGRYTFPHDPVEATSIREYRTSHYTNCAKCHEKNYETTLDSVHGDALAAGNNNAAVCTDCHGMHDTPPPGEPRELISETCRKCHSTIYNAYAESVHGSALLNDSNPDVPVCIDCHGVHDISDPTTGLARQKSPELCAKCHADEALMTRYGISTDVFDTYVADFHGETVSLFLHDHPGVASNKAVCFDCHGVHDIRSVDDLENGIKANLLETCQQCHPDATANFPDAWTSHYQPSLEHNPLVYLVDSFYRFVIPVTLVGLFFLVGSDVYRRARKRYKR